MSVIPKVLRRTYRWWSRVVPRVHLPYRLPTGGRVYIDVAESPMMLARVLGTFEEEKHHAFDRFLSPGDVFLDVGANKGDFSLHAAACVGNEGKVIAFEPEPRNCKWIRKSIGKSGARNVELVEAGLGAEAGELALHIGKKSGWHSFASDTVGTGETVTVPVLALDEVLAERGIENVAAIKIDVEGFEREVLHGARETLRNAADLVLFLDIHPNYGVSHEEIFRGLEADGFSIFAERSPFDRPVSADERPLEIIAVKGSPNASRE